MNSKRRLFLSYAREDHETVANLYRKLKAAGCQPWMDTEDIPPGADWDQRITTAIHSSDYFLACLSNHSVDTKTVLQREIQTALDIWRGKSRSDTYLIPVRLEKCDIPSSLAQLQWVDLFELGGWEKLLRVLQPESGGWIRWAAALVIAVLLVLGIFWILPRSSSPAAVFVALRPGPGSHPVEPTAALIGVTAWELRSSVASDPVRSRAIIHPPPSATQSSQATEYTPLRIALEGALRIGMKFWLGLESSRSGYLYVVDRELSRQGRLGEPFLVFPTSRIHGGNNRVSNGDLVRLPGEATNPPYWVLESSPDDYQGELITLILTPQLIPELPSQSDRAPVDAAWLAGYEKAWGAPVTRVFQGDTGGFAAPAELNSGTRPVLGQTDPPPENIYTVDVKPGRPIVMSVPISIKR